MIELAGLAGSTAMPSQFTPHYRRIIDNIKRQIDSGQLEPGAELPSTRELAAEYGVSPTTVRQAITMLIDSGWLVGHQGLGVFVAQRPDE